jgi:hypothetical protein
LRNIASWLEGAGRVVAWAHREAVEVGTLGEDYQEVLWTEQASQRVKPAFKPQGFSTRLGGPTLTWDAKGAWHRKRAVGSRSRRCCSNAVILRRPQTSSLARARNPMDQRTATQPPNRQPDPDSAAAYGAIVAIPRERTSRPGPAPSRVVFRRRPQPQRGDCTACGSLLAARPDRPRGAPTPAASPGARSARTGAGHALPMDQLPCGTDLYRGPSQATGRRPSLPMRLSSLMLPARFPCV